MKIEFIVFGEPKTAGSKRAFYNPKLKRALITDDNKKSRDWKEQVASSACTALVAFGFSNQLLRGPLTMHLAFFRPRPKGHYKSDGSLSKAGRESVAPSTRPDLLKLARAVEDALKGVIYCDDAQIVTEALYKNWGEPARVVVTIDEL